MLAKLLAPRVERAYIRESLFRRLDAALQKKLIWLGTAAGSGKTTAVASYLAERKLPHVWYQLDEVDADPASFFYYLGQAVQSHDADLTDLPLLTPEYLSGLTSFARHYFRELVSRFNGPFVLVFDDCQSLPADSVLHEVINIAAQEMSAESVVMVTSRQPPPQHYARLQAYGDLAVIEGAQLLLSREETHEFCRKISAELSEAITEEIYSRTRGWITGVLLLMNRNTHLDERGQGPSNPFDNALLMEYFSAEIFSRLSDRAQSLSLQLAMLPSFTLEMMQALLTDDWFDHDLPQTIIQSQFVLAHGATPPTFQFHPLYRDFLLTLSKQRLTPETRQQYLQQAGRLLIKYDWVDEAAELLKELEDDPALAELIGTHAARMLSQGRYQTLRSLFDSLDAATINASAWLCYWSALSQMPFDILTARHQFEQAFTLFRQENNRDGALLAWAGAVQTYHYLWGDFAPLDQWIAVLDELLPSSTEELDASLEWQVVTGMLASLIIRQPANPAIHYWRHRAEAIVFHPLDANRQLDLASKLMLYYVWFGDMEQARHLMDRISPRVEAASPMYVLLWWHIAVAYCWLSADFDRAMDLVRQSIDLIAQHGIIGYDCFAMGQAVYTLTSKNDVEESGRWLEKMQASIMPGGPLHQSHYYYLAACYSVLIGEYQTAKTQIKISLDIAYDCGAVLTIVMAELGLASVEMELGEYGKAHAMLDKADAVINATDCGMLALRSGTTRADLLLRQDRQAEGLAVLDQALALAAKKNMVNFDWWYDRIAARFCAVALRHDIQTDYVRRLIRQRKLSPASTALDFEAWPWPVRIHTLGTFSVSKDDEPITFSGKAQKKTLSIIKAIVALGGREVSEAQVQDALWPDTEGDQARQNLKATVHRVRKLIGAEAILWQEGRLSINPQLCWVDAWAVEQQLDTLLNSMPSEQGDIMQQVNEVLCRYSGPFMQGDDDSYLLTRRERLRSKVLRLLNQAAAELRHQEQHHDAIILYQRALEIEPLTEQFYQGLIRSYLSLGQKAEAQATYERCRKNLMALLKLTPSAETDKLRQEMT